MVTVAVEGDTDIAMVDRILEAVGLSRGIAYPVNGKVNLDRQLVGFNSAARFAPWLVVRDLNGDADCAAALVARLLPTPAASMCFRVAVRAAEAWLMADRERMAAFLGVSVARLPMDPDLVADPKQALVNLARHSRRRQILEDMVPEPGTSGRIGPGYAGQIVQFATTRWRPEVAAGLSPSLAGCLRALGRL
jgi:hypothetical protein